MMTRVVEVTADTSAEDARVLRAAHADEPGARTKMQELLARAPAWIERIGTLAADVERSILEGAKAQMIVEEVWRADVDRLRTSLIEPNDGGLEHLLIQRAAACWAAMSVAELSRQARWKTGILTSDAEFWDRRVSRLQGDFLRACRTLATVRRARLPAVQLNVARQQVNVLAGSGGI